MDLCDYTMPIGNNDNANNALLWRHNHSIVSKLNGDLFLLQGDKAYSFRTKFVHKNNIQIIILNIKKYIIINYSKRAENRYAFYCKIQLTNIFKMTF